MTPTNRPVRWIGETAKQPPTILQHWDGLPTVTLSKITSGARLLWIFHEEFPEQYGVFVHLTTDEAQAVWQTPSDVGLLEVVRRNLRDRAAYVWRKDFDRFGTQPFRIPKRGDEPAFAELLWDAAEQIDVMFNMAKLQGTPDPRQSASAAIARARADTLTLASA